ncbi:MAG: hypothetical protein AVDCRST_MAG74-2928 [uncultured Pyrinomonadaceae bacterium]|uniref:Uncharacterized protein n=1 Tax=uncultured Pyrinomonadaceae bacterium TaxID=2283094 RepID=A0A6J4PSE0_9BACT|nr:MAG: hypothetical protein AVDCRST_MAG74-2928 [uncultured Pyrinomonadaceae bacterium]
MKKRKSLVDKSTRRFRLFTFPLYLLLRFFREKICSESA